MSAVRILGWTPRHRGTLRGFLDAEFPSGLVFHECGVFEKDGQWSAAPPSKPMIGRDGMVLKDAGKTRYAKSVSFTEKARQELWSKCVIAALRAAHPEIFQ